MTRPLIACLTAGALALTMNLTPACAQGTGSVSDPNAAQISFSGDSTQLNTHSNGRHVFVTGQIGEQGSYNMIVDTGAGVNVLDLGVADAMGLAVVGEREVLSGGVEPVTASIVILPSLAVDGLTIENAEFLTMDLAGMSQGDAQFHAVLGRGLFENTLLTFDPRQNQIGVSHAELAPGDPGVFAYETTQGAGFVINIEAAGQSVPMHIDTGASSGFTFPMAISETLPLQGALQAGPPARLVGGERSTWLGTLDGSIELGDMTYENPPITFLDPSAPHGNIGNQVLGDLVMSIDQRHGLLSLNRSELAGDSVLQAAAIPQGPRRVMRNMGGGTRGAANDGSDPRRLGIQLRGMGGGDLSISWVEPGSLGEQAGFQTGDVLQTINGRAASEYDMAELGALFRGNTPLQFEVQREGNRHTLDIP